uniref:Protein involved in establishing cohesion between sister chromatids during dna replication n=2 Tax=Lutzomyia longipalpis TaxID=7200 RepID=A0A1B0CSX5_LUTLO
MDVTPEKPQTETSRGSRHTPTPQMSERKRALFGRHNTTNLCLTVDEDSDLGPMSPIRYSPVEELDDCPRYTFQNILLTKPITPDMDEASNMSSVISDQTPMVKTDAIPVESDVLGMEKENHPENDMKTPEKSLILGDISIPQSLAGKGSRKWLAKWNSDSEEENATEKIAKQDDGEPLKAKTSLTFEPPAISPLRFYTPDATKTHRRMVFAKQPATTGRRYVRGVKRVGLINKGVRHKISRPKLREMHKAVEKPMKEIVKRKVNPIIPQEQIERLNNILKNARNPIEMARPLCPRVESSDEEEIEEVVVETEEEEVNVKPGKFFKSGTKRTKKYQLTNTLSATVKGGKMTIVPLKKRKVRVETFGGEAQDDFREERSEIEGIINQLTAEEAEEVDGIIAKVNGDPYEEFRKRIPYKTTDPVVIDRQTSILELLISNQKCTEETFKVFIGDPENHKAEAARILDEMFCLTSGEGEENVPQNEQNEADAKVFPIFRKNFTPPDGMRQKVPHGKQSRRLWRPIGAGQMQIDAGQKKFGATYCSECNLVYSVHEPEEEKLHWDFHNALTHINFRGWQAENVVLEVPEWGAAGRVICVQTTDSRAKVTRVENLLLLIDAELGAYPRPIPPKAIAYLAIAYNQIMGVCLAEPITTANRLVQSNGVDYFSEETFPAHCGIIKLWTALPFRGQGVARQLIRAVQVHFVFGHILSFDEIAFSSPTEAGREFAIKLTGRNNFLVYP